jgi:S-adenosylmethionine synthetase
MNEMRIEIETSPTVGDVQVEIVERKGLGHPDSICDAVMEEVSVALCRAYREQFGRILHHNCDKALLAAGCVERRFGGGRVIDPMTLIMGDRAASQFGDQQINVSDIVIETAKQWFRRYLPRVDPERHLKYQVEIRPGTPQLAGALQASIVRANDTSAVVGYAPLTTTEKLVLDCECYLNSADFKARFPETGEDVKVLGIRRQSQLGLTVAMPLLLRYIRTESEYFDRKAVIQADLFDYLSSHAGSLEISLDLNHLDHTGHGLDGIYTSLLGTSAEDADSGQVGRGNQVNGIIALNRPRGAEAAAGKNPVSHVGKIYNILADQLASHIWKSVPALHEVTVWMCSRVGDPINQPWLVSVRVHPDPGAAPTTQLSERVRQIVEERIGNMDAFIDELISGKYWVC